MDLKKHGLGNKRQGGTNGRIKALEMPNLGNTAVLVGDRNQFVGFGQRGGQRLFNEHVNAGFHQSSGDAEMVGSGNDNGGGLDSFGFAESPEVRGGAYSKFFSYGLGTSEVGVGDSCQSNRLSLLLELAINAGVVASEDASADDRNVDDVSCQVPDLR